MEENQPVKRTRLIDVPPQPYLAIRREYVGICGGDPHKAMDQRWHYHFDAVKVKAAADVWLAANTLAENVESISQNQPMQQSNSSNALDENDYSNSRNHPMEEPETSIAAVENNYSNGQFRPMQQPNSTVDHRESLLKDQAQNTSESLLTESSSASSSESGPGAQTRDADDDASNFEHPQDDLAVEKPEISVFALYAENIEPLTPRLRDHLIDAKKEYGEAKLRAAIEQAVEYNVRKWKYVEACLKGDARASPKKNGKHKPDEQDGSRYVTGKYADIIQH